MTFYHPEQPNHPKEPHTVRDLIRSLIQEVKLLIEQHIELGKTEIREDASHWKNTLILFSSGALLGQIGILFLGLALMFALTTKLPLWGSALILSILFFIGTMVVLLLAKNSLHKEE